MAVFPSAESDTEKPWFAAPIAPVPTSFACWFHIPPERAYTHAAPTPLSSPKPPTMAMFPSAESEVELPSPAAPIAPVPTSFACWLHVAPERVKTHAAPAPPLSLEPPNSGVPIAGKRHRNALECGADRACTDQFRLLAPRRAGARVHPRGASKVVVLVAADDSRVPVTGQRDSALMCFTDRACTDQFRLLVPHPAGARVHPRGSDTGVVARPTHDSGTPVTRERDGIALRRARNGGPVRRHLDPR